MKTIIQQFPKRSTLRDGSPCSVRLLETGDEGAFRDFHLVVPEREQLHVRNQIKDGSLFKRWNSDTSFRRHLPLMAFVDGRLTAMAMLEQRAGGWKRHIGKVYFLTHPDHRGKGLLENLLEIVIDAAKQLGLCRLESELNGERTSAITALEAAGCQELVRLPDYIQDMKGEYHDYVLMGLDLTPAFETLGVGD